MFSFVLGSAYEYVPLLVIPENFEYNIFHMYHTSLFSMHQGLRRTYGWSLFLGVARTSTAASVRTFRYLPIIKTTVAHIFPGDDFQFKENLNKCERFIEAKFYYCFDLSLQMCLVFRTSAWRCTSIDIYLNRWSIKNSQINWNH